MDRQVITVDIAPGSNAQQRLMVSQGDIGRPLGVRIIQNGLPLNCTGYTAHLYVLKPDHNYYECTCTISNNNLISWDTAEQETPVAGECLAEIRITSGTNDIGTACFVEYVEASPADLGYASESLISSMTEYVDAAQQAAEEATEVVADVDNVNGVAVDSSGHIVLSKVLGSQVVSGETVQKSLKYANLNKTNLTIGSDGGYIKFGTLADFGISDTSWLVGLFIRGWSGDIGTMSLAVGSDGKTIYLMGSKAGTMNSVTVRVWYYEA